MTQEYDPDFLLTWRRALPEKQADESERGGENRCQAKEQEITSEAEALRRWLAAGGNLDLAFLYGLEMVIEDDTISSVLVCGIRFKQ
jgi:hypothetical protein